MAVQRQANPANWINFKQFNFLRILVSNKVVPEMADLPFGENDKIITIPLLKILTPAKVTENGTERNDWVFHPSKKKFNALMASQLIDFLVKQPTKGSNNGVVADTVVVGTVGGWDQF